MNDYDDYDLIEYCINQALSAAVATSPLCDLWVDRAREALDRVKSGAVA